MTTFSLSGDEAVSALLAQRVAGGYGPSFLSGIFETRGELYWYILGLWTRLTELSEYSLRVLSSLWGLAGIVVIYLLGKNIYRREVGLIAAAIYAFSPIAVSLSRVARMYSQWMVLVLLMFYFFYRGGWRIWLGMVIFLAAYFTHRGTLIFIPGIILVLMIKKEMAWIKKIGYGCVLALLAGLVTFHLFQNPRLKVAPVETDSSNEAFIKPGLKGAGFYTEVLLGMRHDYLKKDLGKIGRRSNRIEYSRLIMLALGLLGFSRELLMLSPWKREELVVPVTFISGLLIISFFVAWKWERYLAGLYPFLFLAGAKGLADLGKCSLLTKYNLNSIVFAGLFLLAVNPWGNINVFKKQYNWAPDFRRAYQYVARNSREGDVVVAGETAPALFYLGEINYFSQEEDRMIFLYRDKEGLIKERYTGREVIDGPEKWRQILKGNKRVWFITDIIKFPYKFSEETVSLIYHKFNLIKCFYLVKVFQYEEGSATRVPLAKPAREEAVPLEAKFYYYSGDIRLRAGDLAGGVESLQLSRQINPYYLLPYWRLGEIYTKVGLLEEGLREYEKAYEYGRKDKLAVKFLAEAYLQRGKSDEADSLLKKERGRK